MQECCASREPGGWEGRGCVHELAQMITVTKRNGSEGKQGGLCVYF